MKKMYSTQQTKKDNKIVLHITPNKGRVIAQTTRSEQYSFYTKAIKKSERKLKNLLKKLDFDNL